MDPHHGAQDVTRCEMCETAVVQVYCHSCEVNLCEACIGIHVSLHSTSEHQILGLNLHKTTLIFTKCTDHSSQHCHFFCKECDIPVCSKCISSEKHCRHLFLQMSQVWGSKQKAIEKDTEALQDVILPKYGNFASSIENELENLESEYKKITTMISEHRDELHRIVDLTVSRLKAKIDEIREENIYALRKELSQIKNKIVAIGEAIDENKGILCSNEVIKTLDCEFKFLKFRKLPPKLKVKSPVFTAGSNKEEEIAQLFGSLEIFPITTQREGDTLNLPGYLSLTQLLDEPELVTSFPTGFQKLCNVACMNAGNIWTSGRVSTIKQFDRNGSCLRSIMTTSGMWPADIASKQSGELLYSDSVAKTINVVKKGPVKKLVKFKSWKPGNICICLSGDLLVTMCNDEETQVKVVRYFESYEIQTIQFDDEGKPFYSGNSKIKYISENKNLDICVADSEASAVVVVNKDGRLQFRYTGHPCTTKENPFKPYGITTDQQSQILTSDSNNHCIHIIDQTGLFLSYIDNCNLKHPHGLSVDDKHHLCVAEYNSGKIKLIKYMYVP